MSLPLNQILHGSALDKLRELPDESIDLCVTSPPYYKLRHYKVDGQLGREETPNEYLTKLIEIFEQVKRVIKSTGSIYVNIGDSYDDNKSLVGIPERFALKMADELGLIRRNTIIWYKPNCMPSSASDRFTVDFEYVYFFTKSERYHFEIQYEPMVDYPPHPIGMKKRKLIAAQDFDSHYNRDAKYNVEHQGRIWGNPLGRQKRCVWYSSPDGGGGPVWKISTRAFSDAHFAVYPQQLIEPIVKASCPEFVCSKCGQARKLVYETKTINTRPGIDTGNGKSGTDDDPNQGLHTSDLSKYRQQTVRMPKFGGNRAADYGNPTYSGKEWNPTTRRLKTEPADSPKNRSWVISSREEAKILAAKLFPNDIDTQKEIIRHVHDYGSGIIKRLREMGSDSEGNYNGQSTKDYEGANAQDASETKRRILESYKKRANSELMMTDCGCNTGFESGVVLDPFFGSGTTGIVALQQGKKFVGIELNQSYIDIALKRLKPYLDQTTLTEYFTNTDNSSTTI